MKARLVVLGMAAAALLAFAPEPLAAAQKSRSNPLALAPDGARGFGADLTQRDIDHLWSSKIPEDRAFLDGLTEVSLAVRVSALKARQHYSERGYFLLLPGTAGDDLAQLHATYAHCLGQLEVHLSPGDARAQALAAMLVDTRFNVRRELLERAELALRELERVRAVFGATTNGYASLLDSERQNVAARGDLAAAELRAIKPDLELLTPSPGSDSKAELDLRRELLEIARLDDTGARREMLRTSLEPRRELEHRMAAMLSNARIEPKLRPLRQWRERVMAAGADLRARALEMTPDTPEGLAAEERLAHLGKSERFRQAAALAIDGLLNDPLDPDLAWVAGHARGFFSPGFDEVIYMDRFLALSGVRHSDANPGQGRELTERELEALQAIERSLFK